VETPDRDSEGAFAWIAGLLDKGAFRWVVVGGLAARIYGSPRPLADIDIDVPRAALDFIARQAQALVTFGPARYCDDEFDIELLSLRWGKQAIDLTAAEDVRLFDRSSGVWRHHPTDLLVCETRVVLGRSAPVMPRSQLIEYKRIIDRPVDRADIAALS